MTGAGRMRSIGRPIAVELARAGCDIVLTGTGRSPDRYPDDEKAAGLARHRVGGRRGAGRWAARRIPPCPTSSDLDAVEALADQTMDELGRVDIVVNNAGAARARTASRSSTSTRRCGARSSTST